MTLFINVNQSFYELWYFEELPSPTAIFENESGAANFWAILETRNLDTYGIILDPDGGAMVGREI